MNRNSVRNNPTPSAPAATAGATSSGVPTLAESGLPGFSVEIWQGVAAPARTRPEIVARLEGEIRQIVEQPDVRQRLQALGAIPNYADGAAFRRIVSDDHERFGKVIRDAVIAPN